jgi:hypothetical protein
VEALPLRLLVSLLGWQQEWWTQESRQGVQQVLLMVTAQVSHWEEEWKSVQEKLWWQL